MSARSFVCTFQGSTRTRSPDLIHTLFLILPGMRHMRVFPSSHCTRILSPPSMVSTMPRTSPCLGVLILEISSSSFGISNFFFPVASPYRNEYSIFIRFFTSYSTAQLPRYFYLCLVFRLQVSCNLHCR